GARRATRAPAGAHRSRPRADPAPGQGPPSLAGAARRSTVLAEEGGLTEALLHPHFDRGQRTDAFLIELAAQLAGQILRELLGRGMHDRQQQHVAAWKTEFVLLVADDHLRTVFANGQAVALHRDEHALVETLAESARDALHDAEIDDVPLPAESAVDG